MAQIYQSLVSPPTLMDTPWPILCPPCYVQMNWVCDGDWRPDFRACSSSESSSLRPEQRLYGRLPVLVVINLTVACAVGMVTWFLDLSSAVSYRIGPFSFKWPQSLALLFQSTIEIMAGGKGRIRWRECYTTICINSFIPLLLPKRCVGAEKGSNKYECPSRRQSLFVLVKRYQSTSGSVVVERADVGKS